MHESNRMASVQSPIIPVVGEWIRSCPGTISLGQGVVHYGPPAEALARVESFGKDPQQHKYQLVDGIAPLREALAKKLSEENGIEVGGVSRLVVTGGGNMAFMNAILAVTDPGDEVILQTPYYFNHEMAVTMVGCRPVLAETDERWLPRLDRIRAAVTPRTRAVVTISPNNPTGAVYPESLLVEVNRLCGELGLYHIHDEAYEYFVYGGSQHFSPGSIPGSSGHTICLFSLSKSYGFASWRIGYMTAPGFLLAAIKKIQDTILICPPVISQHAAVGALAVGKAWCDPRVAQLGEVRQMVLEELAAVGDLCQVPPAEGAFYFLVRVRTPVGALEMAERLVRRHKVAVIPGTAFGLHQGCDLRIAYGALQPETVREGMGRFVEGLRKEA